MVWRSYACIAMDWFGDRMSDLKYNPDAFIFNKDSQFEAIEMPVRQKIDRQNCIVQIENDYQGYWRLDWLILDKLNVNINEEWGPIGQLPSVN